VTTQRIARAYTVALIGDPESSAVSAVMGVLARAVPTSAKIVAGDYLDKKNLADRAKAFHIGCYVGDSLIDLINCPLTFKNIAATLHQADRIAWVIRPDEVGDNLKRAIAAAAVFGVRSHVLVVNTGCLPSDLRDPDLLEIMTAEARDVFESLSTPIESCFTVDVNGVDHSAESAHGVEALAEYLVQNWLSPRVPVGATSERTLVVVEQSYSVSGPSGKPARAGYGPVRGRSVVVGQSLTLLTVGGSSDQVRISELQEFGQGVGEAPAGSSAAILFHSAPKDRPKVGDILTDQPNQFQMSQDLSADLCLLPGEFAAQALGSLSGLEVCIGTACVSCKVTGFSANDQDLSKGCVTMRTPVSVPVFAGQPVLAGNGSNIVAWGFLERI
jgi:translation elongation factor EF-Tu-like GTPase